VPRDVLISLGDNLRRLRHEAGLTQEELGSRAGVQMADVSRYESGNRDPRISTVARLAAALEVPIAELLKPTGDSP
jgi:transcriptional regulator with XRE-family HTH domain